ncbi:phage portal protein [Aquabacterium sp. A7-Y]|uniref:phage portal protein n=1 Tax=Aquabacterium sp. A7-Y TaxID=1349605 RepID=UPI00223E2183|nr:phage portal protein [Aquabacterium sp. A7-Y]MCW7542006.1 phage portal protein [Aquabacterium sp. A7-Y]
MALTFNLTAKRHDSRVLGAWLASREGGPGRAGIRAENGSTTGLTAEQLLNVLGLAGGTGAGVAVTPETAMRVSAVYACVSLIAGAIASLPLAVYERDGDARRKAKHDYWWLLNEQAHPDMTAFAAWEYLIGAKLFYGDGYAELLRPSQSSNRITAWRPLHPLRVKPFRDSRGVLLYRVTPEHGPAYVLDSADVIHLPSLGFDGLTSPSPITYAAREAIGIALAAEGYNARFFGEGATFDYALKTESKLGPEQLETLRTSLLARMTGGKNSRAPLILTGGLEPAQLSVNPKDAEILATRLFTVEEICRIFGVPPHMVGHTDKTTSWGSGIEQQGIGFVKYTLQRHLTPIAQEFNRKLWPVRERYFVEHVTAAMERGDLKSRNEAYRIALGRAGEPAWMSANEVRRLENLPPIEGGDTIHQGSPNEPPPETTG